MLQKQRFLALLAAAFLTLQLSAQPKRYLDEVFPSVSVTLDVEYAKNISILTGAPVLQSLKCDIYAPAGDTATNRPLILLAPTGNFLPPIVNGGPTGSIRDSANVELAKLLAKRGYVVASFFYRQGWDPLNPSQDVRTATILKAAYRGIHDARSAARFFRKTVADSANKYGLDPDKIVIGGIGTGGYVSLGAAYLSDFVSEIQIPKFQNFTTGAYYVDTLLDGNLDGTSTTPLNNPNHVGFSSDFSMVFNLGGAMGDSSWIQAGEIPYVGFHTPQDPFAPYDIGPVIVPTTGDLVIDEAAGSFAVGRVVDRFDINQVFKDANLTDVYTLAANKYNNGYEGLFPFNKPFTPGTFSCAPAPVSVPLQPEGSPWSWWDEATFIATWDFATGGSPAPGIVVNCNQRAGNPDMSAAKGRAYLDSVVNYLAPRMYVVMELYPTSVDDFRLQSSLKVYPNPVQDLLNVELDDAGNRIQSIELLDVTGRTVARHGNLNVTRFTLTGDQVTAGVYLLRVRGEKGQATQRVVFQ